MISLGCRLLTSNPDMYCYYRLRRKPTIITEVYCSRIIIKTGIIARKISLFISLILIQNLHHIHCPRIHTILIYFHYRYYFVHLYNHHLTDFFISFFYHCAELWIFFFVMFTIILCIVISITTASGNFPSIIVSGVITGFETAIDIVLPNQRFTQEAKDYMNRPEQLKRSSSNGTARILKPAH